MGRVTGVVVEVCTDAAAAGKAAARGGEDSGFAWGEGRQVKIQKIEMPNPFDSLTYFVGSLESRNTPRSRCSPQS